MHGGAHGARLWHGLSALQENIWDRAIWKLAYLGVVVGGVSEDWASLLPVLHKGTVWFAVYRKHLRI